ncbi:MAG: hypothetical protein AAFQ65_08215, partial [Myxococcota bacterium]
VQFKAFYTKTGIEDLDDLVSLDDRSYAVAEGRLGIPAPLFLVGRFTRQWVLDSVEGEYDSVDAWNVGLEVAFTF